MKEEIDSAAEFLAKLLKMSSKGVTRQQSESFRTKMAKLLYEHFQDHWFPQKPYRGSGYRCLRINHKMDPMISKAVDACGGSLPSERLTLFPNELTIWIDPREVAYRIGENGSICVLYAGESSSESSSDSDLDCSPSPSLTEKKLSSGYSSPHQNGIVSHPFPTPPSSPPTVQGFHSNHHIRHTSIPSSNSCRKDLNLYWNSMNSGGVSDPRTAAMFSMEQIAPYVTS